MHFVEIEGRWINLHQITHLGRHKLTPQQPSQSYIALTSGKTIDVHMPVEQILSVIQETVEAFAEGDK